MQIRDRVRELRRVQASTLRPHPRNWRTHPELQKNALRGLLAEIGYAGALLARTLPDGALELIDGHLRAETTPDEEVPVLVVDLDQSEAEKLLALGDPLAALAGTNEETLAGLLGNVETESDAVQQLVAQLLPSTAPSQEEVASPLPPEVSIPETFQVVVECTDETQQKDLFERLTAEGFVCRLVNL